MQNKLSQPTPVQSNIAGKRVLIVEDEEINCKYLDVIVSRLGLQTETCHDGSEAVEKITRTGNYDLVLLDIKIPGKDGWQVVSEIRQAGIQIPVLATSASAVSEQEYISRGFTGLVGKPILREKLIDKITSAFSQELPSEDGIVLRHDNQAEKTFDRRPIQSTRKAIQQLVTQFTGTIQRKLPEIESAIDEQSFSQLDSIGHWLKGTASNLRISFLVRIGEQLETAGQHENMMLAIESLHQLRLWSLEQNRQLVGTISAPHSVLAQGMPTETTTAR